MKYTKILKRALNALFYLCSLIGFMQFLSLVAFPHLRLAVLILIAVGIFLWCIIYAVETPSQYYYYVVAQAGGKFVYTLIESEKELTYWGAAELISRERELASPAIVINMQRITEEEYNSVYFP